MKRLVTLFALLFFLTARISFVQDGRVLSVSMVQLMAIPEQLNGKVITVRGFLLIVYQRHDRAAAFLYLHEEDQKHSLDNGVLVIPSKQMIKNEETLNRQYVSLTGKAKITPTSGLPIVAMTDIQSCVLIE
jgi:hypothetical protein